MPTPTAAQRALSLPELLSPILIHLATSTTTIGQLQQYTPAYPLFPLLRVNTTFHSVIKTTPQLRRLMFLEHIPPTSTEGKYLLSEEAQADSANLRPFWWLLEEVSGNRQRYMEQPETKDGVITLTTTDEEDLCLELTSEEDLSLGYDDHASWRSMPIFRTPPAQFPSLRQTIHLNQQAADGTFGFTVYIFLDEYKTLGELWDGYREIVAKGLEEGCEVFENIGDGRSCYLTRSPVNAAMGRWKEESEDDGEVWY